MKVNWDILIPAGIFHDYGKIFDYTTNEDGTFEYTEHKEKVRHLPRSYHEFMKHDHSDVSEDLKMQIGHCILSHHGREEWGSPVLPQTPEAYTLHVADYISANCTLDQWEKIGV